MCTQFLFGSARGIRSATKSYSLGIMMLCHKDDKVGLALQSEAGYPPAAQGTGKWKESTYVLTNGKTQPSLYVNIYGQTKAEKEEDDRLLKHFESISQGVEGKEESDIRDAHKKHSTKMYEHMQKRCELQLDQTTLKVERDKLQSQKEQYHAEMQEYMNRPVFKEQNLLQKSEVMLREVSNCEVGVTLLSYMLSKVKRDVEERKIVEKDKQFNDINTEIQNTDKMMEEEKGVQWSLEQEA
eukprot:SAG11_NODE_2762_length_3000_cov_3.166494_4_plen_240_part_00